MRSVLYCIKRKNARFNAKIYDPCAAGRDGTLPSAVSDAAKALDAVKGLDLAELFIVSAVSTGEAAAADNAIVAQGTNYPGLTVTVSEAAGEKCPRCWMHSTKANAEGLCPRCAAVVAKLDVEL